MDPKPLSELKTERSTILSKVTRFKTFWDNFDQSSSDVGMLCVKLEKFEPLYDEFDRVQILIELHPDTNTEKLREQEEEKRESFENRFCELIASVRAHINKKNQPAIERTASSPTPIRIAGSPLTINSDSGYRLPKMPLPTFDGTFDNWIKFRDSFEAIVNGRDIAKIDKFHYLNQALQGDAARVIQSLGISDTNYDIAWKCLKDRYEDSDALIHHHTKALCEFKAISKESFIELRQFIDDINNNLRALKALNEPTDSWDTLLLYLMSKKLDFNTKREWEKKQATFSEKTILTDFLTFLENHCKFLQRSHIERQSTPANSQGKSTAANHNKKLSGHISSHVATEKSSCVLCTKPHALYDCTEFKKLPVSERLSVVKKFHLCFNCLFSGHRNKNCQSGSCRKCSKKHHTLVHIEYNTPYEKSEPNQQPPRDHVHSQTSLLVGSERNNDHDEDPYVILSTAIVYIQDRKGKLHECRALLDTGSQPHLITQGLCRKLDLPTSTVDMTVSGVEPIGLKLHKQTRAVIKSKLGGYQTSLRCLVTKCITNYVPISPRDLDGIVVPSDIKLADPTIKNPHIDLLIGAGLFWDLLCLGRIRLRPDGPLLQKTLLGWILAGKISPLNASKDTRTTCHLITNQQLHNQVERLWEVEQVVDSKVKGTLDVENPCEQHFIATTKRAPDGRFIVNVPYSDRVNELGESFEIAEKRLNSVKRKLLKDPQLKDGYFRFMCEYETSGDMTEVPPGKIQSDAPTYYIPHHAVMKPDSTTTKVRVVFDGSSKTTSGLSLNDVQHVGPTVQDDLLSIVLRFRKHRYVLSADIAKMYRRTYVDEEQRKLQRILWRTDSCQPIKVFELNTVTYGTASAPYLATRCLRQLGEETKEEYPTASKAIINDFYVDDLLTGADSLEEARTLKDDLTTILDSAGLSLRKWASNDERVFLTADLSTEDRLIQGDKDPKTLGLLWKSNMEELQYSVKIPEQLKVTKRTILSLVSQIFDPLGLVGPATIRAKILLQGLWELKLDWNESVPQRMHSEWVEFRDKLYSLNDVSVPRLILCENPVTIEIHGFCDASEKAYGASIYIRSINVEGNIAVNLLCAKSRVAPLKRISLPRLELCGALLLAELSHKVINSLNMTFDRIFLWCDSTITLTWIKGPSCKWETYVANRTTKIQELTKDGIWNHVSSSDNPADIISRGIDPSELPTLDIWWHGPTWLSQDSDNWPISEAINLEIIPGIKRSCTSNQATVTKQDSTIFERFSSFITLIRVLSYCFRIRHNLARPTTDLKIGFLTPQELKYTKLRLIKLAQTESFRTEIHCIKQKRELVNSSKLKSLKPFLDELGLLRVGGRLNNASLSFDKRHPIILPSDHSITKLIIKDEHNGLMHAGCQSVVASLREQYWPLSCKNIVKTVLRKCMQCFRVKPVGTEYVMGNLPAARVTPARPFNTCGVDYAGPYLVKDRTRSRTTTKAYLCIFVCFVTKAVHLELAIDLTTYGFLSCLHRFISRRGRPQTIYSDNGTNFVGARNELNELAKLLLNSKHQETVTNFSSREGINWHFIPSHAPHFGGLWESAVKSVKHHLKRVIGETQLTFSELYTVLTQVEACLNSRPLSPLSNDPNDLEPLTPGHFLIGDSLVALPQPDLSHIQVTRLNRYQHLQQMVQHFWQRWQKEYLHNLQQRSKWSRTNLDPIKLGSLVLLKEDHLPPLKWQLGRVTELHPGKDNVIRVVTVRIGGSSLRRPVSKLCVLPIDDPVISD